MFHRHSRTIARLTLLWFALFIGSAIGSSFISSASYQTVCSGSGGMKTSGVDVGHLGKGIGFGCDCPLCAAANVLIPPSDLRVVPPSVLAHALRPVAAALIAWITALPPHSRGPPTALC